ncbi:uncharacterized protein EDB91DRAFT_48864 [Suillus paluster]|uniref:uncharacterized protein n=1 Tax=Suillus paluster TaxID=48578 RepID=UPI001B883C7C|nr:uncharacterized protein EDB91DRAFT_48864 [Suillus paluster]KAG1747884.1 hypothetical protein EDB91DRAFT_48864 [Suillus paluster]
MQTVNSKVNFSPASDIIGALQNILARSQVIMPDLETPYSRASLPNTNHCAVELKDRLISAIITERELQLDAVSHEFSDLETVMDNIKNLHQHLVEKKEKITQSMNLHKGFVSAFWRLPTEVLSQIFIHCLPDTSHLSPASGLAPMLLTRVCRRWREIAVCMPSLWCKLQLEVDSRSRDWKGKPFCYDLWLKRSRGCPLSLALQGYTEGSTQLRSLLQPYINQISSLSTDLSVDVPKLLTELPALQELTVNAYRDNYSIMTAIAQSISRPPFTMRSLRVIGPLFYIAEFSALNLVFAHLTNLEVAIREPIAVPHLLRLCPNLSSLTIRVHISPRKQAIEPFTHTTLQSLCIVYGSLHTNYVPDLFNALSLPNLRLLETRCAWPLVNSPLLTWPHEEVRAFLARSNCPLKSLIFGSGVMMTDEQQAKYVALIPSFEVLSSSSHVS